MLKFCIALAVWMVYIFIGGILARLAQRDDADVDPFTDGLITLFWPLFILAAFGHWLMISLPKKIANALKGRRKK